MMIRLLTLLLFISCLHLSARTPKEYSLRRTEIAMKTEGITFKPFRDMTTEPVQPLTGHFFTRRSSSSVTKIQAYKMKDLWRLNNMVAIYQNALIKLTIMKVDYLIPSNIDTIAREYVDKAHFQKNINPIKADNEAEILKWLQFVTGKKPSLEEKYRNLNYYFKTKSVIAGQKEGTYQFIAYSKDKRVYYISLEMAGAEARDTERAMKAFMRYMKIEPPKDIKASKFQSSKFKPSGNVIQKYQDTIEEVKKQVLNTKNWWFAQTDNYVLKSNMPTKMRTFARKVQEHVEFIRGVYEKFIPPIDEIDAVSIITIPSIKEEYASYTQAPSWSAGVWMSSRKELAVSP